MEALYNKYRPQNFREIIGQQSITQSIQRSLIKKTLGPSLLFAGTRGTGKTSTARILAKALNCKEPLTKSDCYEPCNVCFPCRSITAGAAMEVVEIDAASNNGVDQVRELIETLHYSTKGHRVVILDEVHMLSRSAFNALLKTLEEPPPNTTLILVTTERQKILSTVRSRCQICDFQEPDTDELKNLFADVMQAEGIDFDDQVPFSIALKARGSVRDGLSHIQTLLSEDYVEDNTDAYFALVAAIYAGDFTTSLSITEGLLKSDSPTVIVGQLQSWFHQCSLESYGMLTDIHSYFENHNFDVPLLMRLFDTSLEIYRDLSNAPNSAIALKMGLYKLSDIVLEETR